jgi:hypothetical protein
MVAQWCEQEEMDVWRMRMGMRMGMRMWMRMGMRMRM